MVKYKGCRISDTVLYFHGGVIQEPFVAKIIGLTTNGMATLIVWMDGQWRQKQSCFHKDAEKHQELPKFALQHGMWCSPDQFEDEQEMALLSAEEKKKSSETKAAKPALKA